GGERVFAPTDCWGLRRGQLHLVADPATGLVCRHAAAQAPAPFLCVPMMAQGQALGVLHLRLDGALGAQAADEAATAAQAETWQRLARTAADSLVLALANLKLRQTLRIQSIRDPVTGLYNRRYLEETLEREVRRADRAGQPLGVIMADIDHFKTFNDT